jgi:uncharacterized protein with GYD domain
MPTYVSLVRLTEQGVRDAKGIPQRIVAAERLFSQLGANLKEIYLVNGRYDYVVIMDAPDELTATRAALAVSSLGNVRTETSRAYTRAEIDQIASGLP